MISGQAKQEIEIPRNGWGEKHHKSNSTELRAQFTIPAEEAGMFNYNLDEIVKFELISELVYNMFKTPNLVHIEKQFHDYNRHSLVYRASVRVSQQPNNWEHVIGKSFFVNGVEFTESQIIDALINTFPELII